MAADDRAVDTRRRDRQAGTPARTAGDRSCPALIRCSAGIASWSAANGPPTETPAQPAAGSQERASRAHPPPGTRDGGFKLQLLQRFFAFASGCGSS